MTHPEGKVLLEDTFDGSSDPGWRIRPVRLVDDPAHGRTLHLKAGDPNAGLWLGWAGDDTWENYRVELEVLPEDDGFVGLDFHVRDDGSGCCNLHFQSSPPIDERLFEGCGRWDDVNTSWKLGPLSQRTAPVRPDEWIRLRLDVGNTVANLFVNGDSEPVFTIYDLPFNCGGIRLWRYYASAFFRDLRVTALGTVEPLLEDVWGSVVGPEVIHDWKVSGMLPVGFGAEGAVEVAQGDDMVWRDADADRRGVVNVIAIDPGEYCQKGVVFAKTTVASPTETRRMLRLTYTDQLSMWLNGESVFVGERRGWNDPGRSEADGWGRLMPDQFEVELPLVSGGNEMLVRLEINEPLFGSGFWARLL
jgi:hypothetical protein